MKNKDAQNIMKNLQEDYNLMAESFSATRDRMWPELKFMFNYSKKNEKILDLGCGNGRFSKYLQETDYTGVDFSEKMIEEAKKRFPDKKFIVANVLNLPFEDNYFDKIYSVAMIHQIPSHKYRLEALLEIKRVLKPNGQLLATVWNPKKKAVRTPPPHSFEREDGKDVFLKRERYYYLFKRGELSALAKEAGFKVKEEGLAEQDNRSNIYVRAEKK
ncbi:MAG: class I SAM-dependent methyltransferase [Patescibacteria group bacterium]|nr:class I SAM-dependent methyltransferase [Patescibacteria group bacterium]